MALSIQPQAYCKMMLHAAKHPSSSVLGLCIGSTTPKDASGDGAENIEISEVVPLFHQEALAPMLEAATAMVDQWAADNNKGQIIGCYHANELLKDESIPPVAQSVADKIDSVCEGHTCLLQISNARLSEPSDHALNALVRSKSKTWTRQIRITLSDTTLKLFDSAMKERLTAGLVDFDDHFELVSNDWRNPAVDEFCGRSSTS